MKSTNLQFKYIQTNCDVNEINLFHGKILVVSVIETLTFSTIETGLHGFVEQASDPTCEIEYKFAIINN